MKVELKKLKVYPRLSQETTAFNADIYIDGVKVGEAENDGHGGNNRLHFYDHAVGKRFYEFCESQPPLPPTPTYDQSLPMDADLFIALLVERMDLEAQLAKWKKNKIVFLQEGARKGEYTTVAFKPTVPGDKEAAEKYVRTKFPTATIL